MKTIREKKLRMDRDEIKEKESLEKKYNIPKLNHIYTHIQSSHACDDTLTRQPTEFSYLFLTLS